MDSCCCVILDAEYRNDLSEAILQMQESGKLAALKIKWWKEKRGGGACQVSCYISTRKIFSSDETIGREVMGSIIQVHQHCQVLRRMLQHTTAIFSLQHTL